MKKYVSDLRVVSVEHVSGKHVLIKLTQDGRLPDILPGQFVEVRVDGSPSTFLRRPISVNFVDYDANQLWLLVAAVGDGTRRLASLQAGDVLNCMFPLGNSFTMPANGEDKVLLVGGGVGVAPLLYFGKRLNDVGCKPVFLLGARSKGDLLMLDEFEKYGRVCLTTEDGTAGERGFVTNHSVLDKIRFDRIASCGPKPMMVAVAKYAKSLFRQSFRAASRIRWLSLRFRWPWLCRRGRLSACLSPPQTCFRAWLGASRCIFP